jgi:hypothetical protein
MGIGMLSSLCSSLFNEVTFSERLARAPSNSTRPGLGAASTRRRGGSGQRPLSLARSGWKWAQFCPTVGGGECPADSPKSGEPAACMACRRSPVRARLAPLGEPPHTWGFLRFEGASAGCASSRLCVFTSLSASGAVLVIQRVSVGRWLGAVASRVGEELHSLVDAPNSLGQSVSGGG